MSSDPKWTSDELNRRVVQQRAFEAVIWGMPAVNTELMYDEMVKAGGKLGENLSTGTIRHSRLTPTPFTSWLFTTQRRWAQW